MTFGTSRRFCRIHGQVSEPTGFISSKLPLLFRGPDKLFGAQVLLPELSNISTASLMFCNIPAATLAGFGALPKIYSNNNVQDII